MLSGSRPDAVEVVPGLRIGSFPSRRQATRLAADRVNCVVDLRAETGEESPWPDGTIRASVPMADHGSPTVDELRLAATTVADLLREGHEVLVHCRAGLERAPTVACAVLVLQGWSLSQAYHRVTECRPGAVPTEGQLAALRQLEAMRPAMRTPH